MLYLITGSNGAGKSLRAIWRMYRDHSEGKRVFANGFRNLRVPFAEDFPDPRKWRELPPNSVLYIDEAQRVWRSRPPSVKVPPEVVDLETHRHQGIDIVLITQAPTLIDSHIRHLISGHEHLVAWGQSAARVFKFAECYDDVKSLGTRTRGEYEEWKHPQVHYGDYDSAEVHTKKPGKPWRHYAAKVLFALAGLLTLYGIYAWFASPDEPEPAKEDAQVKAKAERSSFAAAFSGPSGKRVYAHLQDYLQQHAPRHAEMPWTRPVMDDRPVVAEPALWCMSSGWEGDETCTCKTEQGTRHILPLNRCRDIARWGGAYNPYAKAEAPVMPPLERSTADDPGASGSNGALRIMDGSDSSAMVMIPAAASPPQPVPVASPATAPQATP